MKEKYWTFGGDTANYLINNNVILLKRYNISPKIIFIPICNYPFFPTSLLFMIGALRFCKRSKVMQGSPYSISPLIQATA